MDLGSVVSQLSFLLQSDTLWPEMVASACVPSMGQKDRFVIYVFAQSARALEYTDWVRPLQWVS